MTKKERNHGLRDTSEYNAWNAMITRCHRKTKCWKNYGGRGIIVDPEWRGKGGFMKFFNHLGYKPTPQHTLDRINTNGNYEPGNVRWATRSENNSHKRTVGDLSWIEDESLEQELRHRRLRDLYQAAERLL